MDDRAQYLKERRRRDKYNEYMRSIGEPALTTEIEEVQRRLRNMYHQGGMSTTEMQEQSSVCRDVIYALILGVRRFDNRWDGEGGRPITQMRSSTLRRLAQVQYVPPRTDSNRYGARVPAHGKRRRLQALCAAGFTGTFISDQLDMGEYGNRNLNMFMHGEKGQKFAYASSAFRVALLYDKLSCADPEDYGVAPAKVKASKTFAFKNGFAPPSCWDDDTIDDPDAFPEWTGECGTVRGYFLHLKHSIHVRHYTEGSLTRRGKQRREVLCEPCRSARTTSAVMGSWIDEDAIREAVAAGGVYRDIAKDYDCSTMTVQRIVNRMKEEGWVALNSGPRPGKDYK